MFYFTFKNSLVRFFIANLQYDDTLFEESTISLADFLSNYVGHCLNKSDDCIGY